jgi:hypothetical protein
MNLDIFKNSFFVAFLTFIISYVLFYLAGIGYEITVINGKQVRQMSIKYPLAFSMIIWLLWQFYLFPTDLFPIEGKGQTGGVSTGTGTGVKNIEGVGTIGNFNSSNRLDFHPTGILMSAQGGSFINSGFKKNMTDAMKNNVDTSFGETGLGLGAGSGSIGGSALGSALGETISKPMEGLHDLANDAFKISGNDEDMFSNFFKSSSISGQKISYDRWY